MKTFAIVLSLAALSMAQGPVQPCTSTITERATLGCTSFIPEYTTVSSVDCEDCVLTTTTLPPIGGPGPVCVGGEKTAYTSSTKTLTVCDSGSSSPF